MPDFTFLMIPASSDSDSAAFVPLVLCLAGIIYYFWIFSKYRNTDKRHTHERETSTVIQNVQRSDQLVEHRKALTNSSMAGSNQGKIEGALQDKDEIPAIVKNLGGTIGLFGDKK
jgi:hypothetical protein